MKTLLLLRHGKSNWDAEYAGDHERPIAKRGKIAASRVGRFLARTKQFPELVLCSPALRTRQTLDIAMAEGDWPDVDVRYEEAIYLAGYERLINFVSEVPDSINCVMMVGHEPTTSLLAGQLIGSASIKFPTAAIARIDLGIQNWKSCGSDRGTLIWHVIPKHLE